MAITSVNCNNDEMHSSNDPTGVHQTHLGCLCFDMISKLGVKECYIELPSVDTKSSPDEANTERDKDIFQCVFKYPHLLKKLYFNGWIRSDLFQGLIKDVKNLTLLQINLHALSQLSSKDLCNISLPQLRALGVGKCTKTSLGRPFDDGSGLSQLQIFLEKNYFPLLKQLDLRFPIRNFKDMGTLCAILKFLSIHVRISELSIMMEFPVQVIKLTGFEEELAQLLELTKSNQNRNSLKICEIQGIRLHADYPQLQTWQTFIKQQQSLKFLTLRLGYLSPKLLEEICTKNKASLTQLFLYKMNETADDGDLMEPNTTTVFDCKVLSVVTRLESLYALGCDKLTNAKCLPVSLSMLSLSGTLTAADAEHILLELPQLHFISLRNACLERSSEYGISLDLLKRFIAKRNVQRLILNGSSLNEDYPPEGLSNGDPNQSCQLKEFDNWDENHIYLDWELNSEMYYVDKCY